MYQKGFSGTDFLIADNGGSRDGVWLLHPVMFDSQVNNAKVEEVRQERD